MCVYFFVFLFIKWVGLFVFSTIGKKQFLSQKIIESGIVSANSFLYISNSVNWDFSEMVLENIIVKGGFL